MKDHDRNEITVKAFPVSRVTLPLVALAWSMIFVIILFWSLAATASERSSVEEAMEEAVKEALPWPEATFELGKVRVVGELPKGEWTLDLQDSNFRGRVRASVVALDDEEAKKTWVSAEIEVEVPVVVAALDMEKGDFVAGSTRVEHKKISKISTGFFTDERSLEGMVIRSGVREGEVLRASKVELPEIVSRNEVVEIQVRRGAVLVTDRGVAQQAGALGDTVRVESSSTEKVLSALVIGEGVVEIP